MVRAKLLTFLILSLFLISFVSALDIDNLKKDISITKDQPIIIGNEEIPYKIIWEKYPPVKIDNWLGLGETLWSGAIKEHTENCGTNCFSTIDIYLANEGSLIDEVDFYTINKDTSRVKQDIRSYQFYIQNGATEEVVNDYSLVCIQGKLNINGTYDQTCNNVLDGTHIEYTPIWKEYTLGESVPAGKYVVKLVGEKAPERSVDWIITSQGQTLDSWAVWRSGWTYNDLSVYDNFNDASINTNNWITSIPAGSITESDGNIVLVASGSATTLTSTSNLTNFTVLHIQLNNLYSNGQASTISYGGAYLTNGPFQKNTGSFNLTMIKINNTSYNVTMQGGENASANGIITPNAPYNLLFSVESASTMNITEVRYLDTSSVTLNSPEDDYISPTSEVIFNATAKVVGGATLTNMSLYLNDLLNETQIVTGTTNTTTWTKTLSEGSHNWTVQACDSDGDCGFASENRTLTIDLTAPTILINSGNGTSNYGSLTINKTINYTVTDTGLQSCWISYNNSNTTINCATGVLNTTNFQLEYGNYSAIIYANDSAGNFGSTSFNWSYRVFQNYITYDASVLEGSIEDFILNIDAGVGITGAKINYNGTDYSSNILSLGGNKFNISNTLTIPDFLTATNVSFYFNITTSTGDYVTTQIYNQSIQASLLDNCDSYAYNLFNLTLYDERLLTKINGTIEAGLSFLNQDGSTELSSTSIIFEDINNANICSNINLTGGGYFYNLELRYYQFSINSSDYFYVPELYHIQKGNSSNFPVAIGLYDLAINESTEFIINYRDNNYITRPGALLQIQRKYIDEGIFRTVEAPITSNTGSAVGHFDLGSYKYKIIVSIDGEVLNIFDNPTINCESELSGICIINLNGQSDPGSYEDYTQDEDISFTINQNESIITVDYTIPSGETKTVNVVMTQYSPTTNPVVLCNNSLTSSSGSFECLPQLTIGDSEVIIEMFYSDKVRKVRAYVQEDLGDFFLLNNYVIASFFVILLITMMVSSPSIMILSSIFSVVILAFLFLIKGSSIGLILGSFSWLAIAGILILVKINKKEEM